VVKPNAGLGYICAHLQSRRAATSGSIPKPVESFSEAKFILITEGVGHGITEISLAVVGK